MARNIETREGYEFWDRLCRLQRYSFFLGDGPSVRKVEDGTGNWIEVYGAQSVMDDAQSEINELREQNAKLEAEVQALRQEVAAYEDGMRSLACSLGAGGFNAETLTAAQLVEKVQWGVDNFVETQGRQLDEIRSERDALRARVVVIPEGYALVPVEPTREMWTAINKEDDKAYAGGCDHGAQFDWLWQAAIDAAPRLNGKAVSDGLLHETIRSVDDIFWAIHAKPSCQSGVVARCRCRLCAGTRLAMARNDLNALLGEGKEVGNVLVRE